MRHLLQGLKDGVAEGDIGVEHSICLLQDIKTRHRGTSMLGKPGGDGLSLVGMSIGREQDWVAHDFSGDGTEKDLFLFFFIAA